jgi:hypothetical protein
MSDPGIQFGFKGIRDCYLIDQTSSIQVEGKMTANGTANVPKVKGLRTENKVTKGGRGYSVPLMPIGLAAIFRFSCNWVNVDNFGWRSRTQ